MPAEQDRSDELKKLRHSCAHLLAAAVLTHFPQALPTIGPATDDGFYYDFDFGESKISAEDLTQIEQTMHQLVKDWSGFEGKQVTAQQARQLFAHNPYKLELIDELEAKGEPITVYQSGQFVDLCRGGHIDKPDQKLKHFKLMSVAGAYWRGDEKNKMLTRIYGTAFFTGKQLRQHLNMLEEAKKRDHRKLGKLLELFTFSELVGAGLPLWTPKGTILRQELDNFVWQLRREKGYQKVTIPHLTKKDLYVTSGHWDKYADELFKVTTRESHLYALKPMNCPHHTQIFAMRQRSYREMPQRYAETTMVYRDEQSGELLGLSRVLCITQDDAHVFCRESQVEQEVQYIWEIVEKFYSTVGFGKLQVRLSLHDPAQPDKYLGDEQTWQKAESQLENVIKQRGVDYIKVPGEAAFYGPKIDFVSRDSLGREWQVATIQVDRNMPHRFGLTCINEQNQEEQIVMLHAAIMGSIERFLAVLIEHFAGAFPTWLSPVQVKILPISEKQLEFARQLEQQLAQTDIRVELDDRAQTLSAKIRDAQLQKIPYMAIIGEKEVNSGQVTIRRRDGKTVSQLEPDDLIARLKQEINQRSLNLDIS